MHQPDTMEMVDEHPWRCAITQTVPFVRTAVLCGWLPRCKG